MKLGLIKLLRKNFDICEEACVVGPSLQSAYINWRCFLAERSTQQSNVLCNPALTQLYKQLLCLKKYHKVSFQRIRSNQHPWHALNPCICTAKFSVDVLGYTADEDDMVCVKLSVNFMKFWWSFLSSILPLHGYPCSVDWYLLNASLSSEFSCGNCRARTNLAKMETRKYTCLMALKYSPQLFVYIDCTGTRCLP